MKQSRISTKPRPECAEEALAAAVKYEYMGKVRGWKSRGNKIDKSLSRYTKASKRDKSR